MLGAGTVKLQGDEVDRRAVAFVGGKTVVGVGLVQCVTQTVARDFGQDGGGRNRGHFGITFHDGFGPHGQGGQAVAVDEHQRGFQAQAGHGALHGQQRGLQDVQLVYFLRTGLRHRKTQGFGADFVEQAFAPHGCQFFGVCKSFDGLQLVQHHGSRYHRARSRATARFVHTGHQGRRIPHQRNLFARHSWLNSG